MERQAFAAVEDEVRRFVEGDRLRAGQGQRLGLAHRREQCRDRVDIDAVGFVSGQAEQHRLVGAVALAGRAERAVELGLDTLRRVQHAVVLQPKREQPRRAHRADGVRAARPDADLEEVEDGDGHSASQGVCDRSQDAIADVGAL